MKELEMALSAVSSQVEEIIGQMVHTPKRSNEYNYLVGKLEAYTDVQNLLMWRLNELRKETKL